MNEEVKFCPPCHGDCNQGRNCNANDTIGRLMFEVNRLAGELEKAHSSQKKLSDADILEYVYAFSQQECSIYSFQEENLLQMIRAILKKASEK